MDYWHFNLHEFAADLVFCSCTILGSALVFVEKQEKADMLFKDLLKTSYPCLSLHGGKIRYSHPYIVSVTGSVRFSSPVRPTVHTNPSRKRNFSKMLFKPEEFENAGFAHAWTKNILKTDLFENNDVTTIMWFPWPRECGRETFNAFPEWNLRFQILPALRMGAPQCLIVTQHTSMITPISPLE